MEENKPAATVQSERKTELRSMRGLPAELAQQVTGFCCEARADGLSLDDISAAVAERFRVKMSKGALSWKFRNDRMWSALLKEKCSKIDAEALGLWSARKPQRIARYTQWAEAAAKNGDYSDAGRLLFLIAKEQGDLVARSELTATVTQNCASCEANLDVVKRLFRLMNGEQMCAYLEGLPEHGQQLVPLPPSETMLAKALSLMNGEQRVKYLEWLDSQGDSKRLLPALSAHAGDPNAQVY